MNLCRIYCEGKGGSLDYDILEKVLGDLSNIEIKPIGGKREAKSIIGYLENPHEERYAAKSSSYLLFRDRDFDCQIPSNVQLTQDKYVFFSYRITIENYLINSQDLFDFDMEKGTGLFTSVNEAEGLLREVATDIKNYQAVRHALGKLREKVSFRTSWMEKDGDLPLDLGLDMCIKEAYKLICDEKSKTERWTDSKLEQNVDCFLSYFDDDFFNRQDYLVWFQGKDLAKSICRKVDNFPIKAYYKFAKSRFKYEKFADLVELRRIVENKIQ